MTDALIGRLTHKGHIIAFVGEPYRFRHRLQQEQQPEGESKPEVVNVLEWRRTMISPEQQPEPSQEEPKPPTK
jgi:hypothetical protein